MLHEKGTAEHTGYKMQITNLPTAEGNNATQTALLVMLSMLAKIIFETSYATLIRSKNRACIHLEFNNF